MELITENEKDTGKLSTPRGDEPLKGKTETKEKSWNPAIAPEKSQEG